MGNVTRLHHERGEVAVFFEALAGNFLKRVDEWLNLSFLSFDLLRHCVSS